jgi:hypothetical protein
VGLDSLPQFVSTFTDRIGVTRLRFRRAGYSRYLPLDPTSDEFKQAYAACLEEAPPTPIRSPQSAVGQLRACLRRHGWKTSGDYVYWVATKGMAKIGFSSQIVDRVGKLQAQSPTRLRLLAAMPGGRDVERELHQIFAEDRIKGEWFRLSPRLKAAADVVKETGTFANIG